MVSSVATLASAAGAGLYAFADGAATSPATCPNAATAADQCTLAQALSLAAAGDVVYLATPGGTGTSEADYTGNWTVNTTGTSATMPLTLEPAPGVAGPILNGNDGSATGCTTSSCDGAILTIGDVFIDIDGITIENGNNDTTGDGGAIENAAGGAVTIANSTLTGNAADTEGGAVGNGDADGNTGTLTVTASTFSDNTTQIGGAIDNGQLGGDGTVSIAGSTFSDNAAAAGGAISNAFEGNGTLSVGTSTFSGNTGSVVGGAIANAIMGGTGTVSITASTFSGNNTTRDGGAVDNGDFAGKGTLTVTASTFTANTAGDGGAISNFSFEGTVRVSASTFSANTASHGGAIDNSEAGPGTVVVSASTFSANQARDGASIDNGDSGGFGTVWAAADIFSGGCDQVAGSWNDEGYNVGSDSTCMSSPPATGDIDGGTSLAGLLGPLADNGGPTDTIAPLEGDPAIGAILNPTSVTLDGIGTALCSTTDQRGVTSPPGMACNAGAVQPTRPVARAQSYLASEGIPLTEPTGSLQAGVSDTNPTVTSWTAQLVSAPGKGTMTVNPDGSFSYTPEAGFVGLDSFSYTLTDNLGYKSLLGTAAITVAPLFSSLTVDGSSSATTSYGNAATFGESGIPTSSDGSVTFSTTPGGLALCSISFPTTATSCRGPDGLAPGKYTVTASFTDTATQVTTPSGLTDGLVVAAPSLNGTLPATTTTTPPLKAFPDADVSYPNGAIVTFGRGDYVLAGGRAFLASASRLRAVEKVDHAKVLAAPAGTPPPMASVRPGTLLSTNSVNGRATIYVAGPDGELHGFSTSRQFFSDGYDAALVVTVPSLAGLRTGSTAGVAGEAVSALSTRADGAIVDSSGTFYVFAGGRAFGISTPAELGRVEKSDKAIVLRGSVGLSLTDAEIAGGILLSVSLPVYVSYQGTLYVFGALAQLARDGYGGTAAVPATGTSHLAVVSSYSGT